MTRLFAGLLAGSLAVSTAVAQVDQGPAGDQSSLPASPALNAPWATARMLPPQSTGSWGERQGLYYKRNWGVEIIGVKPSAAGYMLTFRYRILDPDKARLFNDRKAKAYLIDQATGITLAVPAMENIGELRQGVRPEADRSYYMVFGNPGKIVKSGSRVTVVIGDFHVEGMTVD